MNTTTNTSCGLRTIIPSVCHDGVCSQEYNIASTSCHQFDQLTVSVFATNVLGNESVSNSISIGQFV